MALEYITNRELENSSGELKGKIRILKLREEGEAQIELTCPECGSSDKRREAWTEPLVTGEGSKTKFTVKCNKCGHAVKMLKLKKEAAKKK